MRGLNKYHLPHLRQMSQANGAQNVRLETNTGCNGGCCLVKESESESRSVVSDSLQHHGLQPTRFFHPWDFPGESTGVGCQLLLQGTFLTQGSNPGLPHCRQTLLPSEPPELLRCWAITGSLGANPRLEQTHPPTSLPCSMAHLPSQPRTAQKLSSLKGANSER